MKTVLIISGISWTDTYQRHQIVANALAHNGFCVKFLEAVPSSKFNFKKLISRVLKHVKKTDKILHGNITQNISIIKLPFVNPEFKIYNNFVIKKNLHLIEGVDYVYTFLPVDITLQIISRAKQNIRVIYDCVRNFSEWGDYSNETKLNELAVLNRADKLFVDSFFLKNKWIEFNPQQLLPTVSSSVFGEFKSLPIKRNNIKNIAYFGTLGKHCDLEIIERLILDGYTFHFFGKIEHSISSIIDSDSFVYHGFFSNISCLMNSILEYSDAIIIPYKGNIDGVIPAKLMQSLLLPIPLFISDFYDSRCLDAYLTLYTDYDDLADKIKTFNFQRFANMRLDVLQFVENNLESNFEEKIIKSLL